MDNTLSKRYNDLSDELKDLFKELARLQLENERLSQENIKLREEVSLLRLYVDTYMQEGESPPELEDMNITPSISPDALEFYKSLPNSFNFSELFELAELLGVDKQKMKGYMTIYLRENMMKQHGTRVEKTREDAYWERPLGEIDESTESS